MIFKQNNKLIFLLLMVMMVVWSGGGWAGDDIEDNYFPCPASLDGKTWGYIDEKGEFIIKPRFKYAAIFRGNLIAAVQGEDDKYGIIDKKGEWVIEPKFDDAWPKMNGTVGVKINGKWGLINNKGEIILEPQFDHIGSFHDGLASVQNGNKGVYVDETGKTVIEHQFYRAGDFSEGLASVKINDREGCGYIDKTGKIVIEPIFFTCSEFSEGLASVVIVKQILSAGDRGYDTNIIKTFIDTKSGYIDKTGKVVIEPKFDFAASFHNGLALIKMKGEGYEYIDKTGSIVMKPQVWIASNFHNGLAYIIEEYPSKIVDAEAPEVGKVKVLGGISGGYIDKNMNIVIKIEGNFRIDPYMSHFDKNGLAKTCKSIDTTDDNMKCGFINRKGEWVIEPNYVFFNF